MMTWVFLVLGALGILVHVFTGILPIGIGGFILLLMAVYSAGKQYG